VILELNAEQEQILEMATKSGMSKEEVLTQAFTIIREQHEMDEWMLANREEIAAQIEQGYAEALRGELMTPEEVKRVLHQRRQERKTA
jgi:predicted transcriptional regulator